jgi:uncharacterized protein YggU (UPF0235/DUF167 family)
MRSQVLQVPGSDVEISKGMRSRAKTIVVKYNPNGGISSKMAEKLIEDTKSILRAAVG